MATVVVVKLLLINIINITSNSRGINAAADPIPKINMSLLWYNTDRLNSQFLNTVIIIKAKVLFTQAWVTVADFISTF